jgi:hypothetical protein
MEKRVGYLQREVVFAIVVYAADHFGLHDCME